LHGRVLNAQGRPAADVDISTFWDANGVPLAEILRIEKTKGDAAILSINEGHMEPWGAHPTKTDAEGRFSYEMSYTNYFLLAIDKQRQQGALIVVARQDSASSVELKLGPLVRLHGQGRVAGTGKPLEDLRVTARLPESDEFPLRFNRLSWCFSRRSLYEILLPPGNYELEVNGDLAGHR
jgi:hypothetical protein